MRLLFIVAGMLITATSVASVDPTGTWEGHIEIAGTRLALVLHINSEDGALGGTMDSPDQGAYGIALTNVEWAAPSIKVEVAFIDFTVDAQINGDEMDGVLTQRGQQATVLLHRKAEQTHAGFSENPDVLIDSDEGVTLAGTLTLPSTDGPWPVLALITGSGPQDRNESIVGHRPFERLAHELAAQGIASLRYDDRGVAQSTGDYASSTMEDFARDAAAVARYLKADERFSHVGLAGHSEGGIVAPMAHSLESVDMLILLAAPAVPGEEVMLLQRKKISTAAGEDDTRRALTEAVVDAAHAVLTEPKPTEQKILKAMTEALANAPEEALPEPEQLQAMLQSNAAKMASPWYRHFLTYDPRMALETVDIPVLALFGGSDLQVPAEQSAPVMREALEEELLEIRILADANHLFQKSPTGLPSEYPHAGTPFIDASITNIVQWITGVTRRQAL